MVGARRRRGLAGLLLLGSLLHASAVAGAPRHEVAVGDEDEPFAAVVWAEAGDAELRQGQRTRISPHTGPPEPPLGLPLPQPSEYEDPYIPPVEPPEPGAGPHLPDLVPLPAWGTYVDESALPTLGDLTLATVRQEDPFSGSRKALRFGVTIANHGRHSLEILGVPLPTGDPADPVRVRALQCVRFAGVRIADAERTCMTYEPVGSLSFHAQHGHLHIDGLAQYRLLRDLDGRPDTSPAGVLSRSEKIGFCMGDTTWLGRRRLVVDTGWYRECRHTAPHVPATFRQGVSPLWGDSYGPDLPGQHLVIDGLPDGFYWIEVAVNPGSLPGAVGLHEVSRANNTSYRRIQLANRGHYVYEH